MNSLQPALKLMNDPRNLAGHDARIFTSRIAPMRLLVCFPKSNTASRGCSELMKKKPVVKGSTLLLVLLLHIAAPRAPAATVNCAGADLSKLHSAVYVSPEGNDSIS